VTVVDFQTSLLLAFILTWSICGRGGRAGVLGARWCAVEKVIDKIGVEA
jgi:hypothetical protein